MKKHKQKSLMRLLLLSLLILACNAQLVSADSSFTLNLVGTIDGGVSLYWEDPYYTDDFDADTFYIQRKTVDVTDWEIIAEEESDSWSDEYKYTDYDVDYGFSYEYRILAQEYDYEDDVYDELYSNIETADYKYIKSPVINTVSGNSVTWTAIDKADGYYIYTCKSSSDTYTRIATVNDGTKESWTKTSGTPFDQKTYALQSFRTVNGVKYVSDYSECVTNVVSKLPFSLSLSKTNAGNVKLTWVDPYDYNNYDDDYWYETDSFTIYRKTSANKTWKKIGSRKTSYSEYEYTFTDKNVPYGVTVYYKIVGSGTAEYWEDYSVTPWIGVSADKSIKAAKVKAPKIKVSTTNSSSSLKVSWTKVTGAAGYKIYASNSKNGKYKLVKTIKSGKTTSWTHKGLKVGNKKYYKVKSYKGKYTSDFSNRVYKKVTKNQKVWYPSTSFDDYGGPNLRDKSVSYSNGKLVYKALVLNDRIFYANKFNWIRITIYADGKVIGTQKFYNKPINLDAYDYKYMTFTLNKGTKKVVNLREANISVEWQYNYQYTY